MQAFWESDFERFSLKLKEHINDKINKSKNNTSSYVIQKKEKAQQEVKLWLEKARSEWINETKVKERQGKNNIAEKVKQELSNFRNDKEVALTNAFRELLEINYPFLAECFITWIFKKYETGMFTLPKKYEKLIDSEKYDIDICDENHIIFSNENLYIEYSIERIIEEFHSDIIDRIQIEEDKWLK